MYGSDNAGDVRGGAQASDARPKKSRDAAEYAPSRPDLEGYVQLLVRFADPFAPVDAVALIDAVENELLPL